MAGQPKNTGFLTNRGELRPGFSFWEWKDSLAGLDAVVVGAGLVGSNAALRLRERHPSWRIAVLDRSAFGGASTRNAGFACFGSPSELLDDWKSLGRDATVELVRMRWEGLQALRRMWGDKALGYRACGAVEAFTDAELLGECQFMLSELNASLADVLGGVAFEAQNNVAGLHHLCGALASPLEGDLDTASLAHTLKDALHRSQIPVLSGVEVTGLDHVSGKWEVRTTHGCFAVPHVLVATNAWSRALLNVDVHPVTNHVVVSHPLPHLHLTQTVHHDRGYIYAREVDGRLLIGGGRHWEGDDTQRVERLIQWAQRHIQGAQDWRTAHHWTGMLGVGDVRQPIVQEIEPGLVAGIRLGGMGVAIGTRVGQRLADLV